MALGAAWRRITPRTIRAREARDPLKLRVSEPSERGVIGYARVYPVAFHIGAVPVPSFGLCVALGSLFACWYGQRWLQRAGFPPRYVWHVYAWMMVAGLLGAKLWYAIEAFLRGDRTFIAALVDRSGVTLYGGLVCGAAAILTKGWIDEVPPIRLLDAFAPTVALGEAIGRIGCFLAGDDYGVPTTLPWGIAFPQGSPPTSVRVHPAETARPHSHGTGRCLTVQNGIAAVPRRPPRGPP